jgi:hypothetical protein
MVEDGKTAVTDSGKKIRAGVTPGGRPYYAERGKRTKQTLVGTKSTTLGSPNREGDRKIKDVAKAKISSLQTGKSKRLDVTSKMTVNSQHGMKSASYDVKKSSGKLKRPSKTKISASPQETKFSQRTKNK